MANAADLAWANQLNPVALGDTLVIRFKTGDYSTATDYRDQAIAPFYTGTTQYPIMYIGAMSAPNSIILGDINFTYYWPNEHVCSYASAKWFKVQNNGYGISGWYSTYDWSPLLVAKRDTIRKVSCATADRSGMEFRGQMCVADSLTISGELNYTTFPPATGCGEPQPQLHYLSFFRENVDDPSFRLHGMVLQNSSVTLDINWPVQAQYLTQCGGTTYAYCILDFMFIAMSRADSATIQNNTFTINDTANSGFFFALQSYDSNYFRVRNNIWNVNFLGPQAAHQANGTSAIWANRNNSSFNRYTYNTVNLYGASAANVCGDFMLNNSGTPNTYQHGNYYGHNTIRSNMGAKLGSVLYYETHMDGDTLEFNTVYTTAAVPILSMKASAGLRWGGLLARHNTFKTAGSTVVDVSHVYITSPSKFVSNIYYGEGSSGPLFRCVIDSGSTAAASFALDSAGTFWAPGAQSTTISWNGTSGTPGATGAFGISGKAVWGSPRFADSSYATADLTPSATGGASGSGLHDTYSGAIHPPGVGHFAITVEAPVGVTVSPVGDQVVDYGATPAFTFSPSAGYSILDVSLDDVSLGAVSSYTFDAVTAPHFLQVFAVKNTYAITASWYGQGYVEPTDVTLVTGGAAKVYNIVPAGGWHVDDVIVDDVSVGAVTSYEFTAVHADHTIVAWFVPNIQPSKRKSFHWWFF